jgi:hypothetical protein
MVEWNMEWLVDWQLHHTPMSHLYAAHITISVSKSAVHNTQGSVSCGSWEGSKTAANASALLGKYRRWAAGGYYPSTPEE